MDKDQFMLAYMAVLDHHTEADMESPMTVVTVGANGMVMIDKLEISDLSGDESIPAEAQEIEREFILNDLSEGDDIQVYDNIERWASSKKIELKKFSHSSVARRYKMYVRVEGDSLLDYLLAALDTEDLRRITVPMDVVAKIAKTKI